MRYLITYGLLALTFIFGFVAAGLLASRKITDLAELVGFQKSEAERLNGQIDALIHELETAG